MDKQNNVNTVRCKSQYELSPLNDAKRAKFKVKWMVKNIKSSNLKSTMLLKCCNFINRLPGWMAK